MGTTIALVEVEEMISVLMGTVSDVLDELAELEALVRMMQLQEG